MILGIPAIVVLSLLEHLKDLSEHLPADRHPGLALWFVFCHLVVPAVYLRIAVPEVIERLGNQRNRISPAAFIGGQIPGPLIGAVHARSAAKIRGEMLRVLEAANRRDVSNNGNRGKYA